MLRGLIYMNPLVIDKISKRFYYYKDSGFIYVKQLLKSFPKDYRFTWVVPDQIFKKNEQKYYTLCDNIENLTEITLSTPKNDITLNQMINELRISETCSLLEKK